MCDRPSWPSRRVLGERIHRSIFFWAKIVCLFSIVSCYRGGGGFMNLLLLLLLLCFFFFFFLQHHRRSSPTPPFFLMYIYWMRYFHFQVVPKFFNDRATVDGVEVCLFKKAQLVVADLHREIGPEDPQFRFSDISCLTVSISLFGFSLLMLILILIFSFHRYSRTMWCPQSWGMRGFWRFPTSWWRKSMRVQPFPRNPKKRCFSEPPRSLHAT